MTHIPEQKQNEHVERQSLENFGRGDDTDRNRPIESESIAVEVVELEELTIEEQHLRLQLERKVERAFYEAGLALMQLRDKLLFRSTHKTFEQYCKDRFGFERRHPYRLIDAAIVVDNLSQMCPIWTQNKTASETTCANISQILPTNECQVRPLTTLEPEQQREAWEMAVQAAGNKAPSGRIVKDVVGRIIERTKVLNPYRVGEVCQFVVKDNPELRGKGGCWCIVSQVNQFSCTVVAWDGNYIVKINHLKPMNYLDLDCDRMKEVCDRITRLQKKGNLEDAAINVLRQLGEVKRPYLTPLEEDLLTFLEQKYGVDRSTENNAIP
jgi:hypothetical protein